MGNGYWKCSDGLRIPKADNPLRVQWDADYVERLKDYFGGEGREFQPIQVPVAKVAGGNAAHNAGRLKFYTRLFEAKEPVPPVLVSDIGTGYYNVLDGNHRMEAASRAGATHVPGLLVVDKPKKAKRTSTGPHVYTPTSARPLRKPVKKTEPSIESLEKGEYEPPHRASRGDVPPPLPPRIARALWAIRQPGVLTDELRKPQYRSNPNPFAGHCFVASNALFHLIDGNKTGWEMRVIHREHLKDEDTHWFLQHKKTGNILDPTADQFEGDDIPYEKAVGCGTSQNSDNQGHPTQRAATVIGRARALMTKPDKQYLGTLEHDGQAWYIQKPKTVKKAELSHESDRMSLDEAHNLYDWFHLTHQEPDENEQFRAEPRTPRTPMPGEDRKTKRICVGPSIYHCLAGLEPSTPEYMQEHPVAIHRFRGMHVYGVPKRAKVFVPSSDLVPDASATGEGWLTKPTTLQHVGQLQAPADFSKRTGRLKPLEAPYLKKAIADLQPGTLDAQSEDGHHQSWNYTHLLSPEVRAKGYTMKVVLNKLLGYLQVYTAKTNKKGERRPAGSWQGFFGDDKQGDGTRQAGKLNVSEAVVPEGDRRQGIGMAMYEAAYSHARRHLGVHTVFGYGHSTSAGATHKKLAAKHGLDYEPAPGRAVQYPSDFDDHHGDYEYGLGQPMEHMLPGMLHAEGYRAHLSHGQEGTVAAIHRGGQLVGRVEMLHDGQYRDEWEGEGQREGLKEGVLQMMDHHRQGEVDHRHSDEDGWNHASKPVPMTKAEVEDALAKAERTPEFKQWFEGSKAVDEKGQPLRFYHGTSKDKDFHTFKTNQRGSWFTDSPAEASQYAEQNDSSGLKLDRYTMQFNRHNVASRVIPVHLSVKNPYRPTSEEFGAMKLAPNYAQAQRDLFNKARLHGHDGVDLGSGIWVAFKPEQIKSVFNVKPTNHPAIHKAEDALSPVGPPKGSHITSAHASYPEASAAKPKGIEAPGGKNLWVKQSKHPSNEGRTLMVQFSSDLLQGKRERDSSDDYYDKLYSKREGYHRLADTWEVPQWAAHLAHSMPEADHYTVRDPAEAAKFFNESGYQNLAFSALDVNKDFIKELAKSFKGQVHVGGYTDMSAFHGIGNIQVHPDMRSFVESQGGQYRPGYDYRHFSGAKVIPRLTLSDGCRHNCTFCCVPKQVTEKDHDEILQQADAFADHLPSELIYLNDKTFGQAPNHAMLPELYQRIKARNPAFKGFVIQTTAAQMKRFTPEYLKQAGIRHVELGIESVNDPILKAHKKPANEALIEEAAQKLRTAGVSLIPNIMVGLPGENGQTYQRTLDWLTRNKDIISHVNAYNLALYDDSELGKKMGSLGVINENDRDENQQTKSWMQDPAVHHDFNRRLVEFASGQLDQQPNAQLQRELENSDIGHDGVDKTMVKSEDTIDQEPNVAAVVMVQDGLGRTLWGKRREGGKYTMPAGHLKAGEPPVDGALRELWEETGLEPHTMWHMGTGNGPEGPVHVYHALAHGVPHPHNDPDREVANWEWHDCLRGPPPHVTANLAHNPNVVYDLMGWQYPRGMAKAQDDETADPQWQDTQPRASTEPDPEDDTPLDPKQSAAIRRTLQHEANHRK